MNKTPGQRIREAREARGIGQGELAKAIGCSPSTLSEIESGESKLPSLENALKMEELLGVSLHWIVYGEEGELAVPTREESEWLTIMRNLDQHERSILMSHAELLSRKK